ncbi:LemA family protein [Nocardia blacklockiae]|uniref:LemA family protein n=1 Tax=Nocardia blacklockiae TaxID=480036 RepID=UPI0018952639|nr:LemA family protein [Nocardia blacklockiae]MBF6176192.1 LemA family protein [Nocardia blacklockiae]
MNGTVGILVVLAATLMVVLWYFAAYNDFVRLRNLVAESWQQVGVELQRRHDLVPNLIATVEQAAAFERGTLTAVVEARDRARGTSTSPSPQRPAADVSEVATAENALTTALAGLQALAEQYPTMSTVRNYQLLQSDLADIEDRIAAARRLYNANVRALNTKIQSAPATVIASLHHVSPAEYFEISVPDAGKAPDTRQLFGTS